MGEIVTDKAIETRGALRFRFRGREVALTRFAPRATVLDWLREDARAKGDEGGMQRRGLRRMHGRPRAPEARAAAL